MTLVSRKWDKRFLALASHIGSWSKDGSTQCGAVIVRPDRTIASMGFNGFPRGIRDDPDMLFCGEKAPTQREAKLDRIIHAEMNAILFLKEPALGYTLYTSPFGPCNRCAVHVIQAGISRVVAPGLPPERWTESLDLSLKLFTEAGVMMEMQSP